MKKLQDQLVGAVNQALSWHDEKDVKAALEAILKQFEELLAKQKEEKKEE